MEVIGRFDKADFKTLGIENVDIKIDTGAYTSSIHTHHIREFEKDGEKILEFELFDPTHDHYDKKIFQVKDYKQKVVKSSFGAVEKRFVIKTKITLFGKTYPIQLSLSERKNMRFPVLIGRRFIKKKFLVNPDVKNKSYKLKNKNLKKLRETKK